MATSASKVRGALKPTRDVAPWRVVLQLVVFIDVPALVLAFLVYATWKSSNTDFISLRRAGDAVLHGASPYVEPVPRLLLPDSDVVYPYVYPQLGAFLGAPFALIPLKAAGLLFLALSVLSIVASLYLFGVKDRRCYAVAMIGAPTVVSLALGTLGPLLLLAVAATWRLRDRPLAGVTVALAAVAKLFLWPLFLFLLVTRRFCALGVALATTAALALIWRLTDARGFGWYPKTLRELDRLQAHRSYSPVALADALHLPTAIFLAAALVGGALLVVRHVRDDRRALSASIVLALLATPIVWSHYLILLLVPLALLAPRMHLVWLLPVALWVLPHPEAEGAIWKIAVALAAMLLAAVFVDRFTPARA